MKNSKSDVLISVIISIVLVGLVFSVLGYVLKEYSIRIQLNDHMTIILNQRTETADETQVLNNQDSLTEHPFATWLEHKSSKYLIVLTCLSYLWTGGAIIFAFSRKRTGWAIATMIASCIWLGPIVAIGAVIASMRSNSKPIYVQSVGSRTLPNSESTDHSLWPGTSWADENETEWLDTSWADESDEGESEKEKWEREKEEMEREEEYYEKHKDDWVWLTKDLPSVSDLFNLDFGLGGSRSSRYEDDDED